MFAQPFVQLLIKENIESSKSLAFVRGTTGPWWIPLTKGQ